MPSDWQIGLTLCCCQFLLITTLLQTQLDSSKAYYQCKFWVRNFFVLDSLCVWNSLFKSSHPVTRKRYILIVSLAPFLSFYCHFIATLLLLCIIYQYEYSSNMLVYFSFWHLVQVSDVPSVSLILFFLIYFLAKQFCNSSISLGLFCGCNNISVLQSSFCHVFCYFFISCIV